MSTTWQGVEARVAPETRDRVEVILQQLAENYQADDRHPWVIAFSGGKDSTLVTHLVFEALGRVRPSRRTRPVHILASDTQVETPAISEFVREQLSAIEAGGRDLGLPVACHLVTPELHETFWVRLIGYGYAAPTRNFRWCTDRLKIKPANAFLHQQIADYGSVVVLVGSRFDESANRGRSIRDHIRASGAINPHSTIKGAWMWAPIRELSTEQVWDYLALTPAPWGGYHRRLQNLYKEANSGECALVLDETTKPCGNSRFGCWVCTVVERDKSIEGFIGSGHDEYRGMAELRDWLIELRDDPHGTYREKVRRSGLEGNGPLVMEVRQEVLRRLLHIQEDLGIELISYGEVALIKQIWISDSLIR